MRRRVSGGSNVVSFLQKNGMFIFLGVLVLAIVVLSILIFTKRTEGFANPTSKTLEYFYMQSCPHCKDFNEVWEKVEKEMVKHGVATAKYDLMGDGEERAGKFKVSGAPTILLTSGDELVKEYTGPRTLESIVAFVK